MMDAQHHIDDDVVGMQQEEEGQRQGLDDQRQQRQQEDENDEDVDEEDDDDGEEFYDESDEDEHDDELGFDVVYGEDFELVCERIARNDPNADIFDVDIDMNNRRAALLGRSLVGNTELYILKVYFMDHPEFTSRGARALARGISGSQIQSLTLEGKWELPLEMSRLCARSMTELYLNFFIGDKFVIQLCESLMSASRNLDHFSFYLDRMTPRGARVLANFLRQSPITSLEVTAWENSASTTSTIQTLLLEGVQHCCNIDSLCLERIVSNMHALVLTVPRLRKLCIKQVAIGLSEIELLAHSLSNNHPLCTLQLWECGLSDEHMRILSPVIGDLRYIKTLLLGNNQIGDAGIMSFVEHWRPQSTIEYLSFDGNRIGFNGAVHLINNVSNHDLTLSSLELKHNQSIGYNGLKLIGEALTNAKIKNLDLGNVANWIYYKDVACDAAVIQEAKCMAAGKAMLEGVRSNRHLWQMGLHGSRFPTIVMEEIDLYLRANRLGRRAVFANQYALPSGVWCHFFAKRVMSSSLMFLFLLELPDIVISDNRSSASGRKTFRV